MKQDKTYLRKKFLLLRKKNYSKVKKFNFSLIFKLIKRHFYKKRIVIAGYYPSNYEVDILNFLKEASKKKFRIALPVIKSSNIMSFKSWVYKEPLYVNKFGILEPKDTKKDFEKLSIKFKELRSLAISYRDEKEIEIGKLKDELNEFKIMVEKSKNSYEEILDKTTKSIEKFIENVAIDQEKNIQ